MNKFFLIGILLISTNTLMALEQEDVMGYEAIVNELKTKESVTPQTDPFANNGLHFGAGYTNSVLRLVDVPASRVTLQGFQLNFGMDLFTPSFVTEINYTNYAPKKTEGDKYSLREYGLRGYFRQSINRYVGGRLGFGLSSRDMTVSSREFTTPLSMVFAGLEMRFGNRASITTELAYKDSLSNDTPERSSMDLGIKLDGHF